LIFENKNEKSVTVSINNCIETHETTNVLGG
jgi:hypothetical protein